jgi:hypothetical protein
MGPAPERLGPSLPATLPEPQCRYTDYSAGAYLLYGLVCGAGTRCFSLGPSALGGDACSEPETMEELYVERKGRPVPDVTTNYKLSAAGVPSQKAVYM